MERVLQADCCRPLAVTGASFGEETLTHFSWSRSSLLRKGSPAPGRMGVPIDCGKAAYAHARVVTSATVISRFLLEFGLRPLQDEPPILIGLNLM